MQRTAGTLKQASKLPPLGWAELSSGVRVLLRPPVLRHTAEEG